MKSVRLTTAGGAAETSDADTAFACRLLAWRVSVRAGSQSVLPASAGDPAAPAGPALPASASAASHADTAGSQLSTSRAAADTAVPAARPLCVDPVNVHGAEVHLQHLPWTAGSMAGSQQQAACTEVQQQPSLRSTGHTLGHMSDSCIPMHSTASHAINSNWCCCAVG